MTEMQPPPPPREQEDPQIIINKIKATPVNPGKQYIEEQVEQGEGYHF